MVNEHHFPLAFEGVDFEDFTLDTQIEYEALSVEDDSWFRRRLVTMNWKQISERVDADSTPSVAVIGIYVPLVEESIRRGVEIPDVFWKSDAEAHLPLYDFGFCERLATRQVAIGDSQAFWNGRLGLYYLSGEGFGRRKWALP